MGVRRRPTHPDRMVAALTADTAYVPFVNLTRIASEEIEPQSVRDSVGS